MTGEDCDAMQIDQAYRVRRYLADLLRPEITFEWAREILKVLEEQDAQLRAARANLKKSEAAEASMRELIPTKDALISRLMTERDGRPTWEALRRTIPALLPIIPPGAAGDEYFDSFVAQLRDKTRNGDDCPF